MILVREQLKGIADGGTIQPASIDLTASGNRYTLGRPFDIKHMDAYTSLSERDKWERRDQWDWERERDLIPIRQYVLIETEQTIKMPEDCAGIIYPRSSLFRMGLMLTAGFVDPGFKGKITVGVFNPGDSTLQLPKGERFCQLVVHRCEQAPKEAYDGHYQENDTNRL